MDQQLLEQLKELAARGERLLTALEARHAPVTQPTEWDALAFRWRPERGLVAVQHPHWIELDHLRGITTQKNELVRNTRQFVQAKPANNALLWGARGTGKSSLIKALLPAFSGQGLRLIEIAVPNMVNLPDIVEPLRGRNERFILFVDDLSFEAGDPSYKALKAALDGSVSALPDNTLIYATSNRRHLMPEYMADNRDAENVGGEIHHSETVEEKISLSERFGLWLSFYPFDQAQYLDIVHSHLQHLGMTPTDSTAIDEAALQWALARGSRSGRAAWQFARDWAGRHG